MQSFRVVVDRQTLGFQSGVLTVLSMFETRTTAYLYGKCSHLEEICKCQKNSIQQTEVSKTLGDARGYGIVTIGE